MADKITLIEFHAHSDGSDFSVSPRIGSGASKLLSSALSGESDDDENASGLVESLTSSDEEGDLEELDDMEALEDDEDDEFDEIEEDGPDESEEGGSGRGRLVGLLAIVLFVVLAQRFRGGEDEDDPFEEEFGQ